MLNPPQPENYPAEDLYDLASALACDVARAEVELVAAELARPDRLVVIAEGAGVTAGSFSQQDLRLIHCAADVARHLPLADILRLARRALQAEHFWDPNALIGFGCMWSNESLALLAEQYPISSVAVWQNARHLLALRRRWDLAENFVRQLRAALTERDDFGARPKIRSLTRTPTIANAPRGKRGAA
jgi:hypothetical protein